MSHPPEAKKRKMEPHLGGDNCRLVEASNSKSAQCVPSGSASGDFIQDVSHNHVAFVCEDHRPGTTHGTLKQTCEMCGEWRHKYHLPLSSFPARTIKTGNIQYDNIISDLQILGYKALQVIAKGRSGTVVLAQDFNKNTYEGESEYVPVAIKLNSSRSLRMSRSNWKNDMSEEMKILKSISHHSIISWLRNIDYKGRVAMVMEFCTNGNLDQLLRLNSARFLCERVARKYFKQIFDGLEYLHNQGIAHRDICTQNMLITQENTIKISDFGHAVRFMTGDPLRRDECGSPGFQAPEILQKVQYNPKFADLWSMGSVLVLMTTGSFPFGIIQSETIERCNKKLRLPEKRVLPLSCNLIDLMKGLLLYLPDNRYTLNRVRLSGWMKAADNKVQIGSFYLVRHPKKIRDSEKEKSLKAMLEI